VKGCTNYNSYPVSVSQRSIGKVFQMDENGTLLEIGEAHVGDVTFEPLSETIAKSELKIWVPGTIYPALLGSPVLTVVTELHVSSKASLSFLGIGMGSTENKDEFCGFQLKVATQHVGPSACAPTMEDLAIPDVDSKPAVSHLLLKPESIASSARKKNVTFGLLLALSFASAVGCLAFGLLSILRPRGATKYSEKADSDSEASNSEA